MLLFEECKCHCHEEGRHVKHIMPCCSKCPHCHKRIKEYAYDKHEEKCAADKEKLMEEILAAIKKKEDQT